MIRQCQHRGICYVVQICCMGQIAFAVFPRRFCFGLFYRLLDGSQEGRLVGTLQRPVTLHNPLRHVGMCPQRNPVGTVECIAHRMIEVIVRVQRAFYGSFADRPQCIQLKGGAGRAYKTLYQQRAVFANQETAIANRLKSFRGSEIVAYSPSPIFLTDAKPLSTIGV